MAKNIRNEDMILNIIVKGEKGMSALDKVTVSTTRVNMTMKELNKHIKLTKTALANAVPGTDNWKALNQRDLETIVSQEYETTPSLPKRGMDIALFIVY